LGIPKIQRTFQKDTLHMGRDRHKSVACTKGNNRNGKIPKTLKSEFDGLLIGVPRDCLAALNRSESPST
jgi:hypothetical protein